LAQEETMAASLMGDFPPAPDRLANWRKAPYSAWGFRKLSQLVVPHRARPRRAGGVRHPWPVNLYPTRRRPRDHPMASEATPLDPDRGRGWRRGFDAIAEQFL
jgi:hypothetical protein